MTELPKKQHQHAGTLGGAGIPRAAAGVRCACTTTPTRQHEPMNVDDICTELTELIGEAINHLSFQSNNWTVAHWLQDATIDNADHINYNLAAPYQRGHVWTLTQRRNLIRSLLLGLPIAAVTVAETSDPMVANRVVDGKQRIETLHAYRRGEFTIPAHWVTAAERPAGITELSWDDLSRNTRHTLERRQLPAITFWSDRVVQVDPETGGLVRAVNADGRDGGALWRHLNDDEQLLYERAVYLLINSGGTQHTQEELDAARS